MSMLALQQSAGNAAVTRLMRRQRLQPRAPTHGIQRYQAGTAGHGGIEAEALGPGGAGLSAEEAHTAYQGNWMRDLSQLNSPAMRPIIQMLAAGEFGRVIDSGELDQMLGQYVPSEHLDNPEGGGTVEDPRASQATRDEQYNLLSDDQKKAFDAEQLHRDDIRQASLRSGLPEYIERGKMHSKEKLKQAIMAGRGPEGLPLMGDALHGVEDYFSHSNFAEACILELKARGDPAGIRLADLIRQEPLGGNLAMLVPTGPDGRVQIQTGHYAGDANKWVSRIEQIQTELTNGELAAAFIKGFILVSQMTTEQVLSQLTAAAGGAIGGTLGMLLGGAGGAVVEGVTGAGRGAVQGAESGFEAGEELGGGGILGGALGVLGGLGGAIRGGVTGLVGGAVEGASEGAREGDAAGTALGRQVGGAAGLTVGTILATVEAPALQAAFSVITTPLILGATAAAKAGLLEKAAQNQTEASGGQAQAAGLSGPTHAQLAKDDPEHVLFPLSRAFAVAADTEIGEAMIAAWDGRVHETTDAAHSLDPAQAGGGAGGNGNGAPAAGGGGQLPAGTGGGGAGNGNGQPKARKRTKSQLFAEVDKRYWAKFPERDGQKLDPKKPEDKPYIQEWVKIRHEVEREDAASDPNVPFIPVEMDTVLIELEAMNMISDNQAAAAAEQSGDPAASAAATAQQTTDQVAMAGTLNQLATDLTAATFGQAESPQQQAVLDLVDKYVCHPDQSEWWVPIVQAH
jgi:hypothetical protein